LLPDPRSREAVELSEQFADGRMSWEEANRSAELVVIRHCSEVYLRRVKVMRLGAAL